MDTDQIIDQAKAKFAQAVDHFQAELNKLRTGRAHPGMLDGVMVEAYGTQMSLNQTASLSAPDAQLLQVTPFDPNNLQAIADAIRNNPSLGLNPTDDGRVVRVPIPPLTEERRRQLAKQIGEKVEEAMISMRNARHSALDEINQAKKDKDIGDDEAKRLQKQIDDLMAEQKKNTDSLAKAKEQELLTI
jgi:ribosome recycling factor